MTALDAQDVRNMSGLDTEKKVCIFSGGGTVKESPESGNVGEKSVKYKMKDLISKISREEGK